LTKDQSIDHHLRATWQAIAKMYNDQAAKYDSTMAMAFVLLNIDMEEGTPSTSIGPQIGMEATSLSRILKSMEDKGAIYREPNPQDGRSVIIKLTQLGLEERAFARKVVIRFNEVIRENVSSEKLNHFFEVMGDINKLIKENAFFFEDYRKVKKKKNGS
jgi:MarR family transcriptional regulator, organic hydroperoxide resistance regulator